MGQNVNQGESIPFLVLSSKIINVDPIDGDAQQGVDLSDTKDAVYVNEEDDDQREEDEDLDSEQESRSSSENNTDTIMFEA